MKHVFLILTFSFSFMASAFSQTLQLHGVLTDSISKEALPFGNVFVRNAKDSVISGVLTDGKGNFTLKKIPKQPGLYLQARYFGYKVKKVEIPASGGNTVEMGAIALSQDMFKLKEATVVGTTPFMVRKFDRQVYNMSDNRIASARSVLDLLRTLPGVVVDNQGNIRYKGAPATIYVDDQPASFMYPKVEMIPVSLVKKIELIDASMYNSASGQGGIINIKLKKITTDGLSGLGTIDGNTLSFHRADAFNGFANLNYKIKNVTIFDNFNVKTSRSFNNQTSNGTLNYGTLYYLENIGNTSTQSGELFNYTGAKISLHQTSQLLFVYGFYGNYQKQVSGGTTLQTLANNTGINPYDAYSTLGNNKGSVYGQLAELSFLHYFPKGRMLMIAGQITHETTPKHKNINYTYDYINANPVDSISQINNDNWQPRNELGYVIFYVHPINANFRWNLGLQGHFTLHQVNDNKTSVNGMLNLPLSQYTNGASQYHALFWKFGGALKKWKISGGITMEYDQDKADFKRYLMSTQDTLLHINKSYLNFLPSVTIGYDLDSLQEFKLTYARTITAPYFLEMCGFIDKSDPRNWTQGNPDQKVISLHNLYLGYTYSKEKFNFSAETFFSLTSNDLFYVNYPYSSTIWLTIPENIARKSSLGVDLDSWIMLNKTIDFSLSSSLSHTYINASSLSSQLQALGLSDNNLKKKDFGFNVKFNTNIRFNPSLSGMVYVNYFSRQITFDGYSYGYINSSASLTKRCFNDRLLLTVGVNNLFDSFLNHGSYMDYAGVTETTLQGSSDYKRNYFISLQYKFRQGDRGTKDYKK